MTENIQGGEFTDRESQLPPEDASGAGAQSSTEAAQRDLAQTPIGAPPSDYDVRSVYDSRPVNGYDFNITVTDVDGEATALLEFQVREGFVAVLRGFHHFFEVDPGDPLPAILARSQCLATLTKNGVDVPDNIDVPIGLMSDDIWTGFLIGDEFDTLGIRIEIDAAVPVVAMQTWVHFHGNYLLKTGRAANFEIANPVNGSCAPRVARPMPQVPREAPPPPVVRQGPPQVPAAAPIVRSPPPQGQPVQVRRLHSSRS